MKREWIIEWSDGTTTTVDSQQECKDLVWRQVNSGEARHVVHVQEKSVDVPPVDRSNLCTIHGGDPEEVRKKQREDGNVGQHSDYLVLCDDERAKGFVRPVRRSYKHIKCGTITTMGTALAETYARDPSFYGATFCCGCGAHFPVGEDGEFVWAGTNEKVGT